MDVTVSPLYFTYNFLSKFQAHVTQREHPKLDLPKLFGYCAAPEKECIIQYNTQSLTSLTAHCPIDPFQVPIGQQNLSQVPLGGLVLQTKLFAVNICVARYSIQSIQ